MLPKTGRKVIVNLFAFGICLIPTQALSIISDPTPTKKTSHIASPTGKSNNLSESNPSLNQEQTESHEMIVAGFTLNGKNFWEKLAIQDMNVIVVSGKRRYIQLFRLLKALDLEKAERGDRIVFQPEGLPEVTINSSAKEIEVEGTIKSVELFAEPSDITQESDIFLPAEIIADLFGMDVKWDEQNYEFSAWTSRKLKIWKVTSKSIHDMQVMDVPTNLPEIHPQAFPSKASLDFLELRLRSSVSSEKNFRVTKGGLDTLQQSFWGSLAGGAYRLQFSEPEIVIGESESFARDNSSVMLTRGEWNKRFSSVETSIGDSVFGLNDLTFPGVSITGVRVNGITGITDGEKARDRSGLGLRNYFVQPQVFDGTAPRGSQVDMIINGRTIDSQEAVPERHSQVGMGSYRFEDIILPPGSLNEVLIVITDPSGFKTHIQRNILGSSLFLPKGRIAYIGGIGTGREIRNWHTRGIFAGGRALYAVSDRFTIGGTTGFQQSLYNPLTIDLLDPEHRQYPDSSLHVGGQFLWQPSNYLVIGADSSLSNGRGISKSKSYNDLAFKIKGDIYPTNNASINSQFFRYGPDFFNGQDTKLHDRQGYAVDGRWGFNRDWIVTAGFAHVENNLRGDRQETLSIDFQKLEIMSKLIPYATVAFAVDRLSPNWNSPNVIYILKVQAHPIPDVSFDGALARGDSLYLDKHSEFLSGINVPGVATFEEPSASATLRVTANRSNELGLAYVEGANRKKGSFLHTFRGMDIPLRVRSELGYDLSTQNPVLENRSEYIFDGYGNKSLELVTRFEEKEWTMGLFFNFVELLGLDKTSPVRLNAQHIRPENGGVRGRVFLDYNANAEMDRDEPGVEGVKVVLGGSSCLTDNKGYFILPGSGQPENLKVFIDLKSVPAIYSPTHGIQSARINPGMLTEINLGVTPVISIAGLVLTDSSEKKVQPLSGVRVFLTGTKESRKIAESITAGDGSYYIGDVRPGKYLLQVDQETLPKNTLLSENKREILILPDKEPQEVNLAPFQAMRVHSN